MHMSPGFRTKLCKCFHPPPYFTSLLELRETSNDMHCLAPCQSESSVYIMPLSVIAHTHAAHGYLAHSFSFVKVKFERFLKYDIKCVHILLYTWVTISNPKKCTLDVVRCLKIQ